MDIMTNIFYPNIQEKISKYVSKNGLRGVHIEKNGYRGCFASLCIHFGSAMEEFIDSGTHVSLPSGTAHFLEHMIFAGHKEDTYSKFYALGADVNAYTSPDMMCFYFECSQNKKFYDCLSLLFDTVFHVNFDKDAIENERNIILEEYFSCQDEPEYILSESLMKQIIRESRISFPVLGRESTIRAITSKELDLSYSAFFKPSNMVLSTWGALDINKVQEVVFSHTPNNGTSEISICSDTHVGNDLQSKQIIYNPSIKNPLFMIGAATKLSCTAKEQVSIQAGIQIICNCLFGSSSSFFYEFYTEGKVNAYSPPSVELQLSYLIITLSGESNESEKIFEKFKHFIDDCSILISDEDWENSKKSTYGNLIHSLESKDDESITIADGELSGYNFLELFEVIANYQKEDAIKLTKEFFPSNHFTYLKMMPESSETI